MAIVATVGMQLFGGQFTLNNDTGPYANFDTFPEAFLSVFQVMVSDDWTSVLFSGVKSQADFPFGAFTAAAFFIVAFVLTHCMFMQFLLFNTTQAILVDLAVAVILENFELDEDEKRYGQVVQLVEKLERKNYRTEATYFR